MQSLGQISSSPENKSFDPAAELLRIYRYDFLKEISDKIIQDPYSRQLVPKSIYEIQYHYGDCDITSVIPTSGQELVVYKEKIPFILLSVKDQLEKELGKEISIETLLEELSNNQSELFPYFL